MPKKSQIPWQLGIQGSHKGEAASSDSSVDNFWDSMSNLAKMKTATQAGNLLQDPAPQGPSAVGQITEVARAFGLNMPEMAKEQNRLMEQLAEAKASAQRAEGRADMGKLEAQIDNLKNLTTQGNSNNDPLREMAVEMAKSALQKSQGPGDDDPVASAYKQFIMNKTLADLEMSQSPPTVADQVGSAVETLRAIKDLSTAFSPPPPPPPTASLSPEKNMELELKKLEIEQQLEIYRINKQTEAESKRAQGMSEAVKMIGGAIEGIGKNIADQLMNASPGYAPSAVSPAASSVPDANHIGNVDVVDPSAVEGGENPLVGKLECPDCGQEAVYITKQMYEDGQAGKSVPAACVACGTQHELGEEPNAEVEGTAPLVDIPTSPAQQSRNGKTRPARRNFVSVD
jgi:hypothetical protein